MDQPAGASLLDHFAALEDPRQRAKVLYPLPEILLLLLCATLAGADDFVEMELWGNEHLAFLRRFLPYQHGIPSHDTLREVVAALDPALFKACFTSWVESLRETAPDLVAVDGKTSRRRHARRKGREPLHLVSAWASRQRLVLGQEAVAGKSNEITAIPLLLERLALKGALVTIDAIGTQSEIAQTILARGGDYLLALKANRPATFKDVEAFFTDPPPGALDSWETTDGDHGRIEIRRHAVCHDVAWLFSDRRYPGEVAFPGLAMIGMVESRTERGGKTTRERRYFLSSAKLDARAFARAVRSHWEIEIVFTQMTKAHLLAGGAERENVADLDLTVADQYAINQQLHELALLREVGAGQARLNAPAEPRRRGCPAGERRLPIRLRLQLIGLKNQSLLSLLQHLPPALVFRQRNDGEQVGFGQPLQLPLQPALALA